VDGREGSGGEKEPKAIQPDVRLRASMMKFATHAHSVPHAYSSRPQHLTIGGRTSLAPGTDKKSIFQKTQNEKCSCPPPKPGDFFIGHHTAREHVVARKFVASGWYVESRRERAHTG
jgi:hypothetical protein